MRRCCCGDKPVTPRIFSCKAWIPSSGFTCTKKSAKRDWAAPSAAWRFGLPPSPPTVRIWMDQNSAFASAAAVVVVVEGGLLSTGITDAGAAIFVFTSSLVMVVVVVMMTVPSEREMMVQHSRKDGCLCECSRSLLVLRVLRVRRVCASVSILLYLYKLLLM